MPLWQLLLALVLVRRVTRVATLVGESHVLTVCRLVVAGVEIVICGVSSLVFYCTPRTSKTIYIYQVGTAKVH
jgi:hypothetical protein